jgi:hypothetical protein
MTGISVRANPKTVSAVINLTSESNQGDSRQAIKKNKSQEKVEPRYILNPSPSVPNKINTVRPSDQFLTYHL